MRGGASSTRAANRHAWVASTVLGWGWKARPAMGTRRPRVRSRGAGGGRRRARDARVLPRAGGGRRRARDARVLRRAGRGGCAHSQRSRSGPMVSLSRQRLSALVPGLEDAFMRPVARDTEALQLLTRYVRLFDQQSLAAPELRSPMVNHVYDLVALALGATRDAAAVANGRGVRAARLHAIKTEILTSLNRQELSLAGLAARHRVTPRHVQMPFESDGTTFSRFLLDGRLARASYVEQSTGRGADHQYNRLRVRLRRSLAFQPSLSPPVRRNTVGCSCGLASLGLLIGGRAGFERS